MKRGIASIVVAVAFAGQAVQAHHSIAGVYDTSRQVTVEGVVTTFHFVNPHPFLTMEVIDAARKTRMAVEVDNRYELAAIGVTLDTWNPGDQVVVTGYPGRTQRRSLYVSSHGSARRWFLVQTGRPQPTDSPAIALTNRI